MVKRKKYKKENKKIWNIKVSKGKLWQVLFFIMEIKRKLQVVREDVSNRCYYTQTIKCLKKSESF